MTLSAGSCAARTLNLPLYFIDFHLRRPKFVPIPPDIFLSLLEALIGLSPLVTYSFTVTKKGFAI
jgi:hypothetical protein